MNRERFRVFGAFTLALLLAGCGPEEVAPTAPDLHGLNAVHYAARAHDLEALENLFLYGEVDPDTLDEDGIAVMHRAVRDGKIDLVLLLLTYGADPVLKTSTGWTPIQLAARGGHTELVRLFISRGADVNSKTPDKRSPLAMAVKVKNSEMVVLLLLNGADANSTAPGGEPLLHAAIEDDSPSIVGLLLRNGADVHKRNGRGASPFAQARAKENMILMEIIWGFGGR